MKADGTCGACPTNATCDAEGVIKACNEGFYKDTTATPNVCTSCRTNQSKVLTCSGAVAVEGSSANITLCMSGDGTNNYHLVADRGCVTKAKSEKCLTIAYVTNAYKCDSCIDGYYLHLGTCVPCNNSNFGTGAKSCVSAANTTDPAVVTCNDGYIRDTKTTSSSSSNKCIPCTTNCATCTTITGDDIICATPAEGYAIDSDTKRLVACSSASGCTACTLSGTAGA